MRISLTGRVAASVGAIGAVTAVYVRLVHVNPTTIALTYVVVILLLATGWGIAESTIASVVAVLCFNFFFLPPIGTFTIGDPQNWVALFAFLATAIVASQLSGRARQRHNEIVAQRRDVERLYALSRSLLLSKGGVSAPGAIARHIAGTFELQAVGLYDQRADRVTWAGALELTAIDGSLRDVARRGTSVRERDGIVVVPIQLGGVSIGSVAVKGGVKEGGVSETMLSSIANLAAIGLERARAEEATASAEAARQSSELRATVLDALAHEFKTPLTSIRAAAADLRASTTLGARERELATIVNEELDRLQGLVTDAVRMLKIDAGDFEVHVGRHSVAEVVAATLERFENDLDGHQLVKRIPPALMIDADRDLLDLALRQLLDNALKYSPVTSTIEIAATANGAVEISVRNSGSTIAERERARITERFYRGSGARNIPGTGMGLTIVQQIVRAHGGTLNLTSSNESGTAFTLSLPRGKRPS